MSDGGSSGSEDEASGKRRGGRCQGRSAEWALGAVPDTHDNPLATLQEKLKELNTAYELVVKNMTKFASELESGASKPNAGKPMEKITLLKITSAAVVKVSWPALALRAAC